MSTPYTPRIARITQRREEAPDVITFAIRLADSEAHRAFRFDPGQFNMLYCFGVGEVPISIVSDPDARGDIEHTIRIVGNVTGAMAHWQVGDTVGIRGPYGRGWPMQQAIGRNVIVITGGLGCAPVAGAIEYILRRRSDFGELHILHGVKTPRDLLYRERFREWGRHPRTQVYLTADRGDARWHHRTGVVTNLFDELPPSHESIAMMCGPEVMMRYAARRLIDLGLDEASIFVSMERNMKCATGLCGHCQTGPYFACKDGPVFRYDAIRPVFAMEAR